VSELIDLLHVLLRASHAVAGFVGLAAFWFVVCTRKGSERHRRVGRVFVFAAFWVGGTALVASTWALLHLESFAPWIGQLPDPHRSERQDQHQFLFALLTYLAVATIRGAVYGSQSIRLREDSAAMRQTSLPVWQWLSAACACGLGAFGAWHLLSASTGSGVPWIAYWIPFVLGLLGCIEGAKEMRKTRLPLSEPRQFLYRHVEQMIDTSVAFHTAFLVFGIGRLVGSTWAGPISFLPWILPVLVGAVATKITIARLRRGN
jgi:hypothetical protein